jgi:sulfite reductase alpha subunit-like flavoprotein
MSSAAATCPPICALLSRLFVYCCPYRRLLAARALLQLCSDLAVHQHCYLVLLLFALQAAGSTSPATAVLYFGCRKADEDYLYEQDWAALEAAGALQSLRVAFSRAQASKVYVQHLIKEDSRSVAKLIAAGAHVYVCGDGAAMAKDVHATLLTLLRDEMGLSEAQAAEELSTMAKAGRYVRDIWS